MEADGTAEHFEDDAKIIASSRKRREPDDFGGDLERKEKRSRHVDAEHEVGASTRGHLKFQDTVGRKDKYYVTPPSPESPTTSASMGRHSFKKRLSDELYTFCSFSDHRYAQ